MHIIILDIHFEFMYSQVCIENALKRKDKCIKNYTNISNLFKKYYFFFMIYLLFSKNLFPTRKIAISALDLDWQL